MLRKICNHPDLTSEAGSLWKAKQDELKSEQGEMGETQEPDPEEGYGDWRRSGKMIVIHALFNMWREQGHRVLVFSQTRQVCERRKYQVSVNIADNSYAVANLPHELSE